MSTAHRLHVFAEAPVEPLRNSFTIQLLTSVSSTTPPSPSNYWHLYLPQHHLHHPITVICIFHSTTFTIQLLASVSSTAPPSPSNYWHLYLPQHHLHHPITDICFFHSTTFTIQLLTSVSSTAPPNSLELIYSTVDLAHFASTVQLHLSGLNGTVIHPDMQKIRIIGLFFESGLH